ncbi:MAG: RNA-binding protein [Verrucomicrobiaceae bacterium]|nr:RNA-binding protein [Verrucomicrobiaceae bacterium]
MYVGNLPFTAPSGGHQPLFSQFGAVTDVYVAMDKMTGRPRGFAFVTMGTPEEMTAAINGLNGQDFGGRKLGGISEARPKSVHGFGGGGGSACTGVWCRASPGLGCS